MFSGLNLEVIDYRIWFYFVKKILSLLYNEKLKIHYKGLSGFGIVIECNCTFVQCYSIISIFTVLNFEGLKKRGSTLEEH